MNTQLKKQIVKKEDGTFEVLSSSGDKYYTINKAETCSCPAYSFHREKKCRHLQLLYKEGYLVEGCKDDRLSANLPKFTIVDGKVRFI